MHARWTLMVALAATAAATPSCIPMEQAPPPFFTPRPPYAPEPLEPGPTPPQSHDSWNRPTHQPPATNDDFPYQTPEPPDTTSDQRITEYPLARKSRNPEEVISPYPPNHRVNISGFQSGQLARDPYTDKIFRIP